MARFIKIYILFSIVFLCGSCSKKDDTKDRIQKVSARIAPILDTISLDYAQYVNYNFVNYTRENVLYRIDHFSPDTSLRYHLPVYCNANTGRVEEVPEPSSPVPIQGVYIPTPREEAMRSAALSDTGNIEKLLKQMIRFRETIGSSHIYYFGGARVKSDYVSKYDFKVAFNDKGGWQYYLLTHFRNEDDISAEKIRVTERWCIEEIAPPDHR